MSDKIKKLADRWKDFKNGSDVMIDDHDHYLVLIIKGGSGTIRHRASTILN